MDQQKPQNSPEQVTKEPEVKQEQPQPEVKVQDQPKVSHNDPTVRMILNSLTPLGFNPNDPIVQDAVNGNTSALARQLYQQGAKGGWDIIEALDTHHKQQQAFQQFQKQSSEYALQESMGGKDRWNAIMQWAQQAGTPEEFAEVQQDLAQGGRTALRTAQWLENMFNAHGGQVVGQAQQAPEPKPINPASTHPQQVMTYSPKEFRKELLRIRNTQGQQAAEAFFLQYNPD